MEANYLKFWKGFSPALYVLMQNAVLLTTCCIHRVFGKTLTGRWDRYSFENQLRGKGSKKVKVKVKGKVKWSRYRSGVAQRVGRGIALLFHDRATRREWVVSSTPRPHFTPGKEPVRIWQEAGCTWGLIWTGGKSHPHRDSIPNSPARSSVAIPTELPGPRSKGSG